MENPTFYVVDVFAEEKYAGNQLAVVRGAGHLPDEILQKIAAEMNYSETTFVLSEEERGEAGGYDVRIFTPEEEVPFAGHPTLGTADVIRREILARLVEEVTLNLQAGRIPVTFGDVLWMRQLPPAFGATVDPARLALVLGIEEEDFDARYPIQEVSTGLPALISPLNSLDALQRCRANDDRLLELVEDLETKNVLVFCPGAHEGSETGAALGARVFTGYYGIPEDPATGSAAGCLAGYLVEHRYFDEDAVDVRVEQGYEIGRPSLLYLRAERAGDGISVSVGGKVQVVAKGELL